MTCRLRPRPNVNPDRRFVSSISDTLTVYYTATGSTRRRLVTFNAPIRDGAEHLIILSVAGATAALHIDDLPPQSQPLAGPVTDCGAASANCVLLVGQRPNGAKQTFGVSGTVTMARLYPTAAITSLVADGTTTAAAPPTTVGTTAAATTTTTATAAVSTSAGPAAGFVVVHDRFMAGRNQGGSQPAGVSLEACVQQCSADPLCLSLDTGKGARAGACFLSYENRASIVPDGLTESTTFDYYEKI